MKRFYAMFPVMVAMMFAAFSFTSCDTDDSIAYTLEGTWKGDMYITSQYNGRTYDASYSEITFLRDPYTYSSGSGYWVDYYSNAPWDYVANHIEWNVRNGIIYVYFYEEDIEIEIHDYRLSDNHFVGTIYDGYNYVDFNLYHTSSPNWSSYDYWGYDGWYDGWYDDYYYARSRNGIDESTDSIVKPEKPVRRLRTQK